MGYVPQILLMIFFIIFLLIASHCTSFNADGLKEVVYYSEEDNGSGREQHIEKVAGQDENEVKKAIIFEKIRSLLGLKNNKFHIRRKPSYGSPSPSPLPAAIEPPAEPPVLPIHHAYLHHRPRLHRQPPPHKEERQKGGSRRILVAVLVSTGGATFVLCAIGLIWGCGKFRKQRRRSTRTVSIIHNIGSKYVSCQNSVKKVTSDPGPDLFYLDSLGTALEPQPFCFKPDTKTIISSSSSNQNIPPPHEVEEESEDKLVKSESNSVGEIMSDHESVVQSIVDDEVVIPVEADSSDDESFHSVCNSHSTDDTSEIASPNLSNVSSFSVNTPINLTIPWQTPNPISSPLANSYSHAPPPPPPPSSIPRVHISPSHTCSTSGITSNVFNSSTLSYLSSPKRNTDSSPSHSCSTSPTTSKDMNSSTLQNLSSPKRNADSSPSGSSNKTTRSDFAPKPPILIPPPPCPPPFSKGNVANSLKGPPPPPPQFTPFGKGGSPLPKLKPLHWDKVRAAPDRSMVWDKLRSNSFEFDEKMIESLFGYNLQNSMKNEEAKSKTPSPGKHVLEPKRLQNITILSKALNATPEQVCDALMQGGGLSLQQLEALVKMEPTKDEQAKLTGYKGDANELGSAERFVKAILKIPFAFSRIEAMLYRETFEDEVVHLRKSFSMLEEACKELRSSRLFLKLLEAVLKTGNRMNVGTIRGGARAFKLDALLKLADVKGTDGKTTLLHFVVQEIVRSEGIRVSESIIGKINQKSKSKKVEDREEDYRRMGLDLVSGLCTELCNVKKTATVDLDVLASSVTNLSDGMTKLQHLVLKDLSVEEKSGNFVHSMKSFICYAGKNLMELQEDEHRVLLHVREITEYFHGNLNKDEANPLRIFVIVRDFLGMLDHVCKELRSSKVLSNPNPLSPFR